MQLDVGTLASAITGLRKAMNETQEGMARRLGCPLSSYVRWEKGRSEPGGLWVLRMLQLCPDRQVMERFGMPEHLAAETAEREERYRLRRPSGTELSDESWTALHTALDTILERAPKTIAEKVVREIDELAGKYGRPK